MMGRVERLREQSLAVEPFISVERAVIMTRFYMAHAGRLSVPVMRATAFEHLCERKTIYIGADELIVGERGPEPKATPTFPELTCHTLQDLEILNTRPKTPYRVGDDVFEAYRREVIPYWERRSMRSRIFETMPTEWRNAYDAGVFTEFMEQRAPGHTVLDGKIYSKGMMAFKRDIARARVALDHFNDPLAYARDQQLRAMETAADAAMVFAKRHSLLAARLSRQTEDPVRRRELEKIAEACSRVPAHPPRDFHEALQMYWFCHLGVITELNGWDSFNPGHLDQHLYPFYKMGLETGTLTRDRAKELLQCFFIKFNNHPAPPKVGVTAAESGTYTDFANINLGGLTPDGRDGVNEVSYLLLEVIDELHLLQPSNNIQVSRHTSDAFLKAACRVIRKGYGFPSVFNADAVVQELLRQGKSLEDARQGGCSGCVEAGAFGKEAYILTGYFNLVKVLELTLNNGRDPRTGKQLGLQTGERHATFQGLFDAWAVQLRHFIDIKIRGNQVIEQMYARTMPAPFLSLLIDDCIKKGMDYQEGGARYNTSYIQGVGIGSLTDSFSALKKHLFEEGTFHYSEMLGLLRSDFADFEVERQTLLNKTPRYGNDDDAADDIMRACFDRFFECVDGRPNTRGGRYHIDMLPTTCHIYFGSVVGATPDGRHAGQPLSEGISPVQGADVQGPTAVLKSAGKMDHLRTGGTLLNQKFTPQVLEGEAGIEKLANLIRTYFRMDGHHIQFNVIDAAVLRDAQAHPEDYRHLIVRVAGYSDYFVDLDPRLQAEIIARTEQGPA
jgi:pyruvate formate-lyase/glycerol dehydratase family glycyl radical enzyme